MQTVGSKPDRVGIHPGSDKSVSNRFRAVHIQVLPRRPGFLSIGVAGYEERTLVMLPAGRDRGDQAGRASSHSPGLSLLIQRVRDCRSKEDEVTALQVTGAS